jgi:hypothetical protein
MHSFFHRGDEPSMPFEVPRRVYARPIDGEDFEYLVFDAVHAEFFDSFDREFEGARGSSLTRQWRASIERGPIYAIEVNARASGTAANWLKKNPREGLPEWAEIDLTADPEGEASVYNNIAGASQPARILVRPASESMARSLRQATDLTPDVKPEADIKQAVPKALIDQIFVLDVGQGAANALVNTSNEVIAYVDLGAGVLKDAGTWPSSMGGICLAHGPKVILTHWHYDHFQAANIYAAAQRLTWIAPFQKLGPGPQSAMAGALAATGTLMVWKGSGTLKVGSIELERCTGPASNQNRDGIAVWVHGPGGTDPILLPGDAGYSDVPGLAASRAICGLVVAHHGGRSPGVPPARPGAGTPRAALSYGHSNSYGHPLAGVLSQLRTPSLWGIGHPAAGLDERRTEDRPGGTGGPGLGHIRMNWSGNTGTAHSCFCGCTLDPTQ